ncbi:hypothetical protein HUJ04_010308 [Dendroctonus ponderosae]|nr:hypothetical protein HUJ04_010308 [Dendroctonus ponderosae]
MIARIAQVDNGFFEKFGSLFREQAEMAQTREQVEKEQVAEAAAQLVPKEDDDEEPETPPASVDSETSSSHSQIDENEFENDFIATAFNMIRSSVSEIALNGIGPSKYAPPVRKRSLPRNQFRGIKKEELQRQTSMYLASMTIDELYTEILYIILHNVGCDVNLEVPQNSLFSYAQDAFRVPHNKHLQLLDLAEKKEDPELIINVEVIEAKDLRPKDSNGNSDPFVTLYLASNTSHRYNTSVKPTTLNPVWEEHFALPITDKSIDDTLCLEVWDFDPAETVKEKLGKLFDVKGVKGMRKLVKEIAVTAATGQHDNELIGRAKIPLNTIPASGMTMWYTLDKKNKITRQGVLKVRICFSSGKNNQVAAQEHRHIRRIILVHELDVSKPAAYWWCENFGPEANQLLTQHIAQSGLSPTEVALCSYSVYAGIHQSHPLSFCIFSKLLEKLLKPLQTEMILEEDMKLFWEATRKLLPSCFAVIRRIRKKNANEKTVMKQVIEVLKIFNYVMALEPTNIDLFPQNLYPWITFHGDDPNCDIAGTLQDAISKGAGDWLNYLIENNKATAETALARLQNLIQLLQLVRSDLQKAIEFYDKLFIDENIDTVRARGYDFGNGPVNTDPTVDPLAEGTSLFDLYLTIQRFVTSGQDICPSDYNGFHIKNFHQWFHAGVAQWLDIAVYKALQRIEKAIELDQLVHIDTSVKYSSSAVDTLTIFYQVNTFWQQLNWPNVESCYTFIAKIIDDICRCCIFYAEKMASKVDGMGDIENIYEKKFEVTNEWCLAINNIDYVRETLEPFTNGLGMEEILKKILELKSPVDAQRCRDTLNMVISNAIDTVRNAIIELLQTVVQKMAPSMKRLLIEGAELCNQDNNSIDRLMSYVDRNLETMHRELNKENFNRTLEIVWDMLSQTLDEIIQTNLENRRPPSFFANLQKTLKLMLGAYKDPTDCTSCDSLKRTEQILRINGLETSDLIHEVHLELAKKFDELPESPYGEISFRCKFDGDVLQVEVINARDLAAMDSSGASDSFVRIHLLPEHKFSSIDKPKTKTHNKTLFPLYDETFTINLSPEQREIKDGLVLLSVKDKDMLGYNNQYIGEAFLRFKDIPITSESLSNLPQVKKWLGRPTSFEMDTIKALEHRLGDKQAKEFLKKFKQRLAS